MNIHVLFHRDTQLAAKLARTYALMDKLIKGELYRRTKLSIEQATILHLLHYKANLTIAEIMQLQLKEHHSVSTLLSRMCDKGLIAKERKEGSRCYFITITEKGKELFNPKIIESKFQLIFSILSKEEKEQLDSILTKLFQYELREFQDGVRPYS